MEVAKKCCEKMKKRAKFYFKFNCVSDNASFFFYLKVFCLLEEISFLSRRGSVVL